MERALTTRGFGVSSLVPHDIVRELAPAAQAHGYAMLWINDLPQASGLAALGVAARAASEIELGVGVLAVDRWRPDQVREAIEAAGIDPRRLTIGIGAGQMTVGAMAALSAAATGLAEIGVGRVVVGSLGPRMTRLGGEETDGVLLNWVTPSAAASLGAVARHGAAGLDRQGWVAAYVRVASDRAAEHRLSQECAAYEGYPAYARHLERFGVRARDTCVLGDPAAIRGWLGGFDGVVEHLVVRAIAAEESVDGYLDVLRSAAPTPPGETA